jgi:hypothetical protein
VSNPPGPNASDNYKPAKILSTCVGENWAVGVGLALLRLEEVLAANPPLKLVGRRRQKEGQAPSTSDPEPDPEFELRPYLPPWWPSTFDLKTGKPRA